MGALTPEGKVKAKVVKVLKEHGIWYFFPANNGYGKAGIPDIVCCVSGAFLGIEVKSERGVVSALQAQVGQEIHRAGGNWIVVRCDDDVVALRARLRILEHVGRREGTGAGAEADAPQPGT